MKRLFLLAMVLVVASGGIFLDAGCAKPASNGSPTTNPANLRVRQAAVAGLFYPASAEELGKTIDRCLADASSPPVENLRALICPHAGYAYSGAVAGVGYKQMSGRAIDTVVLLGPTHHAFFKGGYIPPVDACETPLGRIPLAPLAAQLARKAPFSSSPEAQVQRPDWWRQSPQELPAFGKDTPDTWEHSVEVQLPFIQKVAPKARIVPIVCGDADPRELAESLLPHLDGRMVLVASSDLSHYMPYETARHLDNQCISAVLQLAPERIKPPDACGCVPVSVLLHLARAKGWQAKLLDYRNSGDTTGDRLRVVGYAAIAFYESSTPTTAPATAPAAEKPHSLAERRYLLTLARMSIRQYLDERKVPQIDLAKVPPRLVERKGCFVTLTKKGQLRGCIGSLSAEQPLFAGVVENAIRAGFYDPRFTPLRNAEMDEIEIEVSILTTPQRLRFDSPEDLLARLRPGKDGVILRVGRNQATYLPQVWRQIPKKEEFLSRLAEKAGLSPDAWKQKEAVVETYEDEAFKESAP